MLFDRMIRKGFPSLYSTLTLAVFINASVFASLSNASHFRGGTVWWQPSLNYTEDNKEIQIEYQLGWRTSYNGKLICSEEQIQNKTVIDGIEAWAIGDVEVASADFICAEYDPEADWMIGYNRVYYTSTETEEFTVANRGRCWVQNLFYNECLWSLAFSVILGTRSDTKRPNSSPKTGSFPVIRMKFGCPTTVKIPTTDPDGDAVTCRFAQGDLECGEACHRFPYFQLEDSCLLVYNGGGVNTTVGVALIIEDHPSDTIFINNGSEPGIRITPSDRMSSVPLQFLVELHDSNDPCNVKPFFTGETPPDGHVISTVIGSEFQLTISANASTPSENITDIIFIYPYGAEKSKLQTVGGNEFQVLVTWNPIKEQIGRNLICFTAKDTVGIFSDKTCITVFVGGTSSPCSVNNGGCSDTCHVSEFTYYCNCSRECWSLSSDGRTCIPNLDVQCEADAMTVRVKKCAASDTFVTLAHLSEENTVCNANDNDNWYIFSYGFQQCGTTQREDFWEISYWNDVRIWGEEASDGNDVITRGAWYYIPVTCKFSKFGNLTASFQPVDRTIDLLEVPGLGSFTFFMDFFSNSSFDSAIDPYSYPIEFTVNSDIFFSLRAVGGTVGMRLFTDNCIAMPDENPDDGTPTYTMIENGCLKDPTLEKFDSTTPMENRFSIKAFKFREEFPDVRGPTVVNIKCSVMVCTENSEDPRCTEGCPEDGARKKRSALVSRMSDSILTRRKRQLSSFEDDDDVQLISTNITETPIQQVTSFGNIQILVEIAPSVSPPDPTGDGEVPQSISLLVIVSAGVGCTALLMLIIVIVIIVYHSKYIRPRKTVVPLDQAMDVTYVRDIFLPNVDSNGAPRSVPAGDALNEFVWARQVVSGPPKRMLEIASSKHAW